MCEKIYFLKCEDEYISLDMIDGMLLTGIDNALQCEDMEEAKKWARYCRRRFNKKTRIVSNRYIDKYIHDSYDDVIELTIDLSLQ